jgi:hypothetical protein
VITFLLRAGFKSMGLGKGRLGHSVAILLGFCTSWGIMNGTAPTAGRYFARINLYPSSWLCQYNGSVQVVFARSLEHIYSQTCMYMI